MTSSKHPRTASQPPFEKANTGVVARLGKRAEAWRTWLLEAQGLWVVIFLAVGCWALVPRNPYDQFRGEGFQAGAIAALDFEAPFDLPIEDLETTSQKRQKARDDVLPVWDFDSRSAAAIETKISLLFSEGRRLVADVPTEIRETAAADESVQQALLSVTDLKLTPEELNLLAAKEFSADLEDRILGVLPVVLKRGVAPNKGLLLENRVRGITLLNLGTDAEERRLDLYGHLGYPEEVRAFFAAEVRGWPGFTRQGRALLEAFLFANVSPNLSPNNSETLSRREAAAAAAEPVFFQIREGEILVRKGDRVPVAAARAIAEMTREGTRQSRVLPFLGTLLLLLLGAWSVWLGFRGEKVADHSRQRRFNEGLIVLVLVLLGAKLAFLIAQGLGEALKAANFSTPQSYAYAVPLAALALVARLLYTRNSALMLSLVFSVLVSFATPAHSGWIWLYCLGGSLTAIFALDVTQFKQRLVMARVGTMVGLANLVLILIITSLSPEVAERNLSQVGFDLLCGLMGGLIVAAVASFTVPILESFFCITTDIKLVELSNTNLPLLRRLASDAPGSFQHSLMVANLAKAGCEAIGADAVLAYAGGLYHDIGKMARPDYFIENQHSRHNPHDKLQPSMSALVLINHVKVGLTLAGEYNLPQLLRDAIAQHHGTRRISYFFNRAIEKGSEETVREEDYRYPGPKPSNKEMGVLMLADGVEAASRTLVTPTDLKLRTLVGKIVDDCLQDGQLDETDLTLSDISVVSEAFQKVLSNIYHRRIDYPGFDFNQRTKRVKGDADEVGGRPGSGEAPKPIESPETVSSKDGAEKPNGQKSNSKQPKEYRDKLSSNRPGESAEPIDLPRGKKVQDREKASGSSKAQSSKVESSKVESTKSQPPKASSTKAARAS